MRASRAVDANLRGVFIALIIIIVFVLAVLMTGHLR
jgi:hypothetical protein